MQHFSDFKNAISIISSGQKIDFTYLCILNVEITCLPAITNPKDVN